MFLTGNFFIKNHFKSFGGNLLIKVTNLTKRYGNIKAVDNISFSIDKGEIVGFLGPNGAGKSTTMNIITGFLSSNEGHVTVDGFDVLANPVEVKKRLGFLPEQPPLYMDMLVDEYLNFICDLKAGKMSGAKRKEMLDNICTTVRISDVRKRLIKNLSKGYKQRVGLAQAMVGFPEVLILDEPTVGLDPKQIIEMRNVIRDLGKEHTIILSSHILPEVSHICDRVMIINKGKIVASDTPANLSKTINKGNKILVRVKGAEREIIDCLTQISIITGAESQGSFEAGTFDIMVQGDEKDDIREALFFALAKKNLPILNMKQNDLSLEEIFLQVTGAAGVAAGGKQNKRKGAVAASAPKAADENVKKDMEDFFEE